ncbi:MAG: cytochrome b [Methylophilaceae bacterium]
MTATNRYTNTAIVLHWLIGFGILAMFALGWYMSDLPKESGKLASYDLFDLGIYTVQLSEAISPRTFYFNLHKSVGFSLLFLIIFRLYWRFTHQPPALLSSMKSWEKTLAHAGHHTLYLLMLVMPLTGLIMTIYSKYGLKWFDIPLIGGLDNAPLRDIFKEAHELVGLIFIAVIALHIAAALKHKIIDKDETLKRMSLHG